MTAKNIIAFLNSPASSMLQNTMSCAGIVDLIHVSDAIPGITRVKKGKGFVYFMNNKQVTSVADLRRIKLLVIPPAWTRVWICASPKGHLQVTGFDALNRKQYIYHPLWNNLRNQLKFSNLREFGESLPQLRKQVAKDISQTEINERKVLALVVSLMELTYVRVGNSYYEKRYQSHGLTTLKDRHVQINGSSLTFTFKGKKGVNHNISVKNKKLARLVKQCKDIPGKELFQYLDSDGARKSIDSGMVNNYIRNASGKPFSAKDFRTWAGSLNGLRKLSEIGKAKNATQLKSNLNLMIDFVSQKLGNTRAVCKKYYIHPAIIYWYEKSFSNLRSNGRKEYGTWLSDDEIFMLKILKNYQVKFKDIVS